MCLTALVCCVSISRFHLIKLHFLLKFLRLKFKITSHRRRYGPFNSSHFADAISRVTARPRPPVIQPALTITQVTILSSSLQWPSQCQGSQARPAGRRTVLASPPPSTRPLCPQWRRPLSTGAQRPGGRSSTIWTLRTVTVCQNHRDSCQSFFALPFPNS